MQWQTWYCHVPPRVWVRKHLISVLYHLGQMRKIQTKRRRRTRRKKLLQLVVCCAIHGPTGTSSSLHSSFCVVHLQVSVLVGQLILALTIPYSGCSIKEIQWLPCTARNYMRIWSDTPGLSLCHVFIINIGEDVVALYTSNLICHLSHAPQCSSPRHSFQLIIYILEK